MFSISFKLLLYRRNIANKQPSLVGTLLDLDATSYYVLCASTTNVEELLVFFMK